MAAAIADGSCEVLFGCLDVDRSIELTQRRSSLLPASAHPHPFNTYKPSFSAFGAHAGLDFDPEVPSVFLQRTNPFHASQRSMQHPCSSDHPHPHPQSHRQQRRGVPPQARSSSSSSRLTCFDPSNLVVVYPSQSPLPTNHGAYVRACVCVPGDTAWVHSWSIPPPRMPHRSMKRHAPRCLRAPVVLRDARPPRS